MSRAVLSIECFADDRRRHPNPHIRKSAPNIWVAEIMGRDDQYGLKRVWVPGFRSYRHASSTGKTGVMEYFFLRPGRLYEVCAPRNARREDRYFCTVVEQRVRRLSEDEAMEMLDGIEDGTGNGRPKWAKRFLGIDVLQAARQRIAWAFDVFPRLYVSFSGGKDSTVLLHLVMDEAKRRKRKVGLLFIDLEAQYKLTIDHVQEMYDVYADHIEPYWVALPMSLSNAVSQYEPKWTCWGKDADWVRQPPEIADTDASLYPFFYYGMEFEEFVDKFAYWYSDAGEALTGCFVGIRTQESLNRWRAIVRAEKSRLDGKPYTTYMQDSVFNIYPIYDWTTEDIWTYHAKYDRPYNRLYDRMHQAGLTLHQMRICQPYGSDQRKGLWLYQVIEPETWGRVVARVNGANAGAMYAKESGNILGNLKITKPENHTWESFAHMLLNSMPQQTAEHYRNKIAVFLRYWQDRGVDPIPDFENPRLEAGTDGVRRPSWRRICKVLLRNDWWCKGLSFSPTKSEAYDRYAKLMRRRREAWGILPPGG